MKNKVVNSIDDLVNENRELNTKMENLQREKEVKLNKVGRHYENKIDKVLRKIEFNEMQMAQAEEYANKNLGGKQ